MHKEVIIIGAGWLGAPLAIVLKDLGYEVTAYVLHEKSATQLKGAGIAAKAIDITEQLPIMPTQPVTVIWALPPSPFMHKGEKAYGDCIKALLLQLNAKSRFIFCSSTSVYPSLNRIMSESDVQYADEYGSVVLQHAEQTIIGESINWCIARIGGLAGYNRIPGKSYAGKTVPDAQHPVNLIHRDDAVAILSQMVSNIVLNKTTINLVAPFHPTKKALYSAMAAKALYNVPEFSESLKPWKIIESSSLTHLLGYQFLYPNPIHFYT